MATLLAHDFTRVGAPIRIEHLCADDPCFLDRAAHVLLHLDGRNA